MSKNPTNQLDEYIDLVQLNQILPDLQLKEEEIGYLLRLRLLIGSADPEGGTKILLRSAIEMLKVRIHKNQLNRSQDEAPRE